LGGSRSRSTLLAVERQPSSTALHPTPSPASSSPISDPLSNTSSRSPQLPLPLRLSLRLFASFQVTHSLFALHCDMLGCCCRSTIQSAPGEPRKMSKERVACCPLSEAVEALKSDSATSPFEGVKKQATTWANPPCYASLLGTVTFLQSPPLHSHRCISGRNYS
jgi:hypothetical protein